MSHLFPILTVVLLMTVAICEAMEKTVTSNSELQAALDSAVPGDIINIASGDYNGPFTISTSGTQNEPIILYTKAQQVKIAGGGSGVGLTISGNYWTVKYLPFSDFDTGILLQGSGNVLEALAVTDVNIGVDVLGKGNTIKTCAIEAGRVAVHVGADSTVLESNSVRGSDPAVLADSGTCCGRFEWNVAGGKIKVDGVNYRSNGNVIVAGELIGVLRKHGQEVKERPHTFLTAITNFFQSFLG